MNSANITIPSIYSVPCYAKGTKILTNNGWTNIENIVEGDLVVSKGEIDPDSRDVKLTHTNNKAVKWVSSFTVDCLTNDSMPICISKNALIDGPFEDLYVSAGHAILVNNNAVYARGLVNNTSIFQDRTYKTITYYHIELDSYSMISANGVLAETYFDGNNRSIFQNIIQSDISINV